VAGEFSEDGLGASHRAGIRVSPYEEGVVVEASLREPLGFPHVNALESLVQFKRWLWLETLPQGGFLLLIHIVPLVMANYRPTAQKRREIRGRRSFKLRPEHLDMVSLCRHWDYGTPKDKLIVFGLLHFRIYNY
jgi:hypothetical protein